MTEGVTLNHPLCRNISAKAQTAESIIIRQLKLTAIHSVIPDLQSGIFILSGPEFYRDVIRCILFNAFHD